MAEHSETSKFELANMSGTWGALKSKNGLLTFGGGSISFDLHVNGLKFEANYGLIKLKDKIKIKIKIRIKQFIL